MGFAINTRKAHGVVIMDFSGRFTLGEPVSAFREALRLQMEQGARMFVWNLEDLEFLDSAALGMLVSQCTMLRSKGGDAKLVFRKEAEK